MLNTLPSEQPTLTFKEAMALAGVSRSTLYRFINSGKVTGYKIGTRWRFFESGILSLFQPVNRAA